MEFIPKKMHRVQAAEGGGSFAEGFFRRRLRKGMLVRYNGGSADRI